MKSRVALKENLMPKILSSKTRWNCVQTDIDKCETENWREGSKVRTD
jgi:hypothetical protein